MKKILRFCAAVVLTFALVLPVVAGQMTTMSTDPPPSTTEDGQMTTMITGQTKTGNSEAIDPVTQVSLSLLQSLMSLF